MNELSLFDQYSDVKLILEDYVFEGSTAVKTKPKLWEQCKAEAKAKMGGKHSARSMQAAVALYKKRGGGYKGAKKSDNKLSQWTKQKWRTSDGGKSEGKKRYLPDKAWSKLSKKEIAATNRAKAKGNAEGKQFVNQPKKIAKKTKSSRMTEETLSTDIPVLTNVVAAKRKKKKKEEENNLMEMSLLSALVDEAQAFLLEKTPNTEEAMKRYKAGKAGFSDIAHLKAQGKIKRSDGTKRKS